MNFIALRLDEHDSSVCYSNGTSIKYYKPERHFQVKLLFFIITDPNFNSEAHIKLKY